MTYRTPEEAFAATAERIGGVFVKSWTYPNGAITARFALKDGEKTFRPYRSNGDGWEDGDPPGPWPVYRGPDLTRFPGEPVFLVEGEALADALAGMGLVGIASAHGANGAGKTDWTPLAGRDIVILPDNDPAGRKYAEAVAAIVTALEPPATVKIVTLPGLPPKGDIVDWVHADGPMGDKSTGDIKGALLALAAKAPEWTADAVSDDANVEGDVRLGRAFAAAYHKRVRYCSDRETWLVWDRRRWKEDAVHAAERLMQDLARDRLAAAANVGDSKAREAEVRFWVQAMRRNRIEAALWAARSDPRLIVRLADLDADPWALNVANGTFNLKTSRLRRHDPADLITKLAPVEYRPDADQREWLRFLERVVPDAATRAFLQHAAGYSLTGLANEECLFFVCGPTAGGKSTFISAVGSVLGDYAATANFATFLAQRNRTGPRPDIVRLAGKRFVSSVETEEAAQLASGLLKWITGQDRLCERSLYTVEIEFLPTFSLWLVSNFKPRAQDDDSALWRRLMLLPFPVTIPEAERDPAVKARLRDPAIGGPAVLAWLVKGCRDWQKHGLNPPSSVQVATRQWRAENDPIADWLSERADLNPTAVTTFKALNADYHAWAKDNGLKPISGTKLGMRLQDPHGCRQGSGAGHTRTYEGISLKC
ncbi:MAG: phage/plasmid primase, P4 family [Phycisphaerae bacterium]